MRVKLIAEGIVNDVTYATLTNGKVSVTCEDAMYFDFDEEGSMEAAFDEWCELADADEDGYTMEDCNT